ncbi:MAG: ABC transporter substrate-binding protein [Actinomycetota bacterium]|nr:ABC transporter substrate-binding protein [Actinomycetota bacterium]
MVALAAAALAACGSDDDAADDGDTAESTTTIAEAAADDGETDPDSAGDGGEASADEADEEGATASDPFPVTIEHTHGETTIESRPERVVTVGLRDQDAVLAMGVAPVGIQDWFGEQPHAVWPWAQDELGDAEPVVLDPNELDFETIASLDPDVIIGVDSGLTAEDHALLSEIAPTVAQPAEHADWAVPWRERTLIVARALGEEARANELIAEVETSIADAAAAHPELEGATALIGLAAADGQAYAYGSEDVRSRFLVELGLEVPAVIEDQVPDDSFFVTLSPENLGDLDADVLVWIGGDLTAFEGVLDQPVYPARVADQGRDLFLPYDPLGGAISFASVLSLPFLAEELVPELALALDGDPSTTSTYGR